MKFSQNGLYIEQYLKCVNCGVLIYDDKNDKGEPAVHTEGKLFCSSWCVDWAHDREARRNPQPETADTADSTQD